MDILFENRYLLTKAFFKEFYAHQFFTRPSRIVMLVLFFVEMIFIVLAWLFYKSLLPSTWMLVLLFLLLVYWPIQIIVYVMSYTIQYKQKLELHNGELPEVRMLVMEDGIESCDTSSQNKIKISYDRIKKVIMTKHYYLLMSKARICWAFKKDGFVTGDPAEFLSFLRSKEIRC